MSKKKDVTPLDIFKPSTEWVDENLSNQRYSICNMCPKFISLTKQCQECGCFMVVKTKMAAATCPLGKWQ